MRLLRDAKYVTSSVFASLLLASVRSVIVLRLLGPALIGAWKTAILLDAFSEFARAGVLRALSIRVPVLEGQGDHAAAQRVARAAGGFLIWLGALLGVTIFAASLLVTTPELRLSVQFVAVIIALAQPYYYLREMAAATHHFVLRSKENLLRAALDFVAALTLCKLFGLAGFGAGTLLALVIAIFYLARRQPAPVDLKPQLGAVRQLARAGVPFALAEAGWELTRRIDIILLALLLGPTAVGYYGISLLIIDFAATLAQKGVSQVLSPHLLREYGRSRSHVDVAVFYEQPARLFCYVLPPLLGAGAFFLADFVHFLLPQYAPGIEAAKITMWTAFFLAIHASISSYFVASRMLPRILKLFAVLIPVSAAAQLCVIRAGLGLSGVAWCALVTLAVTAALELAVARRSCDHDWAGIARFLAGLYVPVAAAILLWMAVDSLSMDLVWEAPLRAFLFLVLYFPVLVFYETRFALLRTVRHTM